MTDSFQITSNEPDLTMFIHLGLAVSVSFLAAFIDDYRELYRWNRRRMNVVLHWPNPVYEPCHQHLMTGLQKAIQSYFSGGKAVCERADPFDINV